MMLFLKFLSPEETFRIDFCSQKPRLGANECIPLHPIISYKQITGAGYTMFRNSDFFLSSPGVRTIKSHRGEKSIAQNCYFWYTLPRKREDNAVKFPPNWKKKIFLREAVQCDGEGEEEEETGRGRRTMRRRTWTTTRTRMLQQLQLPGFRGRQIWI